MAGHRLVALLGTGVVPPQTPILRADDLGVLRGDGCFETIHVRDQRPWLLTEHLDRMARSAARLDLALPPRADLVGLVEQLCAEWPAQLEGALRLVCTRGPEDGGSVTTYATLAEIGEPVRRARREGVAVRTATLGVPADVRRTAPWLLGGAKTLSYAVNMASLRWAQSLGADDVLWLSVEGYALEAPTATLVWRDGTELCTVPAEPTGILAGTTATWLLDHAGELGLTACRRMVTPAQLCAVDGAWLLSSVRGIAPIRSLDGVPTRTADAESARIAAVLGYATDR